MTTFFHRLRKPVAMVGLGIRSTENQIDDDVPLTKTKTIQLTALQIRTLKTTAVEVIPAPGATRAISILHMHAWLAYNSAAYDGVGAGENLVLKYTNASGATITNAITGTGFADATSTQHRCVLGLQTEITPVANAAVVANVLSGEWYAAAGNSPINLQITYIDLPVTFTV